MEGSFRGNSALDPAGDNIEKSNRRELREGYSHRVYPWIKTQTSVGFLHRGWEKACNPPTKYGLEKEYDIFPAVV